MEFASLIIALVALTVSVLIERFSIRQDRDHYLDSVWRQVMSGVDESPEFSDISKTDNYLAEFDWNQRLRYDSFCIQAWTACYQLTDSFRKLSLDQRLAVEWMVTYHRQWLHGNAQLFLDDKFWNLVEEIEAADSRLTVHRPVPSIEGLASWDDLMDRYFHTFLSPFDPTIPDERSLETELKRLLREFGIGKEHAIADLGCGIGTAFPVLDAAATAFTALDINMQPLRTARRATDSCPSLLNGDLRSLPIRTGSLDLAVVVNSILMESRADNQRAMAEVARVLRCGGLCFFVLPAFETIVHLRHLRTEEARRSGGDAYSARVERAFNHLRGPDEETASYADDGVTRQYFHSNPTIVEELRDANIEIVEGPSKFYYPWELTRTYNYGYYPDNEETWDWIVVGRRMRR